MKFATVLALLTIANANGQKRHHAIRRVQEDQSMSMMLDPNKRTKDTTTTTRRSTKTTIVVGTWEDVTLISLETGHLLRTFAKSVLN